MAAANDSAASAKARRKRKQQQQQQQQQGSGALLTAAWANAKVQRRALSEAWLAFLRMDLPADVLRKVRSDSYVLQQVVRKSTSRECTEKNLRTINSVTVSCNHHCNCCP